jgi:mannose-1-phosphate guanylyltransferase
MKAFLLAAGNGTRLRPLTDELPKCLLPIGDVPLLKIWLQNCQAAGISEVLINVHAHAQKIKNFLSTQDHLVKVVIAEEKELLGSAGTLKENRAFLDREEDFFVLYGDVLSNVNLREMLGFHRSKRVAATLGIYQVSDPGRCGVVTVDAMDIIQNFVEKPVQPKSNWAFSGIMVANQQVLELVPEHRPADIGFHLLPKLAGKMAAYRIREYLLDIGTPHNYTAAQSTWPGLLARQKGCMALQGNECYKD